MNTDETDKTDIYPFRPFQPFQPFFEHELPEITRKLPKNCFWGGRKTFMGVGETPTDVEHELPEIIAVRAG